MARPTDEGAFVAFRNRIDLTPVDFADMPLVLGHAPRDPLPVRSGNPRAASDGERWVAVWSAPTSRGDRDVYGAVIDPVSGAVERFEIASTTADEALPDIVAIGNGILAVVYDVLDQNQRRLRLSYLVDPVRRRPAD